MGNFFSREAGQARSAALNNALASGLQYYLGPTGLPDRLNALGMLNPVNDMEQAGQNAERVYQGDNSAIVPMLTDMATVLAPAAAARIAGGSAVNALTESLTGIGAPTRQGVDDAARRFVADESGGVDLNPLTFFHGTPDGREVRASGGFQPRTQSVSTISDPQAYQRVQEAMQSAENGSAEYFALLDEAARLSAYESIPKPVFLSDAQRVASTYADDARAFDYQSAVPEVFSAKTNPQRAFDVDAGGADFRGISLDAVRRGLTGAGVPAGDIDDALSRLRLGRSDGKISTDDLTFLANRFGFEAVDVKNVRDTYNATASAPRSTVRMMLDPSRIQIEGLAPTDPATARAQSVLDMLTSGRASEVTDEMLDLGDGAANARLNEYLFNNYDMPMDEASRMQRAGEMGLVDDQFHATTADFPAFRPSETGLAGRGVYTGDFPEDVGVYATARMEGTDRTGLNVIPTRAPGYDTYAPNLAYSRAADADPDWPYNATMEENIAGMRRVAGRLSDQGFSGVKSQPGERVTFDPANIRSRFARFDPRLAHLRNLSAAIGGGAMIGSYEPTEDDVRAYLEGL